MKSLFRRLYAALSLAALTLAWPMTFAQAQTPAVPDYVVILGDSQCRIALSGTFRSGGTSLAKHINDAGFSTNVLCHGGFSLSRLISTIPNELATVKRQRGKDPIAIIVFAPGNGNATADEARTFTAALKEYSRNIIWFGPFHAPDAGIMRTHQANHDTISAVLPSLGVLYQNDITVDPRLDYKDKAHFTPASYSVLAARFFPIIRPYLRGVSSPNATDVPATTANPAADDEQGIDAAGRTESQVAETLAIRCGDSNPVFPVHLSIGIGGTTEVNGLTEYINLVYRYMTAIVLVVTIVMVTYGGFKYLMSATPLGVSDGKDIIKNAIIGMTLVLGAYVILNTLNPATTILQFTQPPMDITCAEFDATLGYGGSGPRRNAVSNCSTDADCSGGQKCLETRFVRSTAQRASFWSSSLFGSDGEPTGLASGETIKECSDGKFLAPCGTDDDCKGEADLVCETNSWKLCIKTTNNPVGSPCTENSQCVVPSGGRADCVSGYRNTGTVIEDLVTPNSDHDFALCRGPVQQLEVSRLVENNWQVPQNTQCTIQPECEDPNIGPDSICNGPRGAASKICLVSEAERPDISLSLSPCFRSGDGIYPTKCTTGNNKCVFCKGGRITQLDATSDPEARYIGACSTSLSTGLTLGAACTGGAP